MNIGETIARIREEQGYSQRELAKLLSHEGIQITNQAVSKWENGSTLPSALQFLAICKILNITNIYGTFIGAYRQTPFDALNAEGKKKALEYVDLLLKSGMYSAETADRKIIPIRSMPLYHISVSAGTGQFLDSDNYDLVEVGEEVPMNANFGVRIAGDSMHPRFIDGQIVWVHQQQTINNGEIGIFLYNGDVYCKKFSHDAAGVSLISLNKAYEPIHVSQTDELRVFGKVVG